MSRTMTPTEARAIFDAALEATTDPDERAATELCREYFCNPKFRAALADYVADYVAEINDA